MSETVRIARRFRGPMASGNGGVSAGLLAAGIAGPATVRLRRPPPLDQPLAIERDGERLRAVDDQQLIMEAAPGDRRPDSPIDEDALARTLERGVLPVREHHIAPECFVCGHREDGLRLSPHHLPGTNLWSTVWVPDATVAGPDGTVMSHVTWGSLDCPAGFGVLRTDAEPEYFPALTDFTVHLLDRIPVGAPVAVFGWKVLEDERRVHGASALVASDGTVLATGYAEHARLPLDFANA